MDIDSWLCSSNFDGLCDSDTDVDGVAVNVSQETYRGDEYVYQTMHVVDAGRWFKRKGRKIYSYECWVETYWEEWEETV